MMVEDHCRDPGLWSDEGSMRTKVAVHSVSFHVSRLLRSICF